MFTGSDVRIRDPDQPNMNIAIAFKGASWTDADSIPLMVMQVGVGGWGGGCLRGRLGRCHYAHRTEATKPSTPTHTPPSPPPPPQTMLGAWDKNSGAGVDMASPLAQTVAANKLAHSFMAFNTNYHDTGGPGRPRAARGVAGGWGPASMRQTFLKGTLSSACGTNRIRAAPLLPAQPQSTRRAVACPGQPLEQGAILAAPL